MANTKTWPDPDSQINQQGRKDVQGVYLLSPTTKLAVEPPGSGSSNQRVNAQAGDFVAGSIVDLASLLTSFAELLTDTDNLANLVTLAGAIASNKMQTTNFIGGSAVAIANPYPSADQINLWIDNGQAFFVSTDLLSAANANQAFLLTNPSASGKVFEVFRFNAFNSNANSTVQVRIANPALAALANSLTSFIANMNQASATASVANASYATATTAAPAANASSSIPFFAGNTSLNGMTEFLQNNARLVLNAGESLAIYLGNTAAGKIGANFFWVER